VQSTDLERDIDALKKVGVKFRNDVVSGPGGRQILLEDPSGNPVELFEPALPQVSLGRFSFCRGRPAGYAGMRSNSFRSSPLAFFKTRFRSGVKFLPARFISKFNIDIAD